LAELRELKGAADERCMASEQQASAMQARLTDLRQKEAALNEKLAQKDSRFEKHSALKMDELKKLQELLDSARLEIQSANEKEAVLTEQLEKQQETLKAREDEMTALTSNKTESEKKVSPTYQPLSSMIVNPINAGRRTAPEHENSAG
jgi:predicted  nucleic acid-binding Zn-ribbon protein